MFRLVATLLLLHHSRAAYVTPTFSDRLDLLYEKLERLNNDNVVQKPHDRLYEKLDKLNALAPVRQELTDDDEEMLQAMQEWGMMDPDQIDGIMKDLQSVKEDAYGKSEDSEDSDGDWTDVDGLEGDYPADFYRDEEADMSTSRPTVITPSTLTRLTKFHDTVVSAVDPIAATNERPALLDDSSLTPAEKFALRRAAITNMANVVKAHKCLEPQPRWYMVRHLAPSANIVYMPPCVQLHRCAPDSGCCYEDSEVCAPIRGDHVEIPFFLKKADGSRSVARMRFFNHTHCACVSRETLQTTVRSKIELDNVTKKKSHVSSDELPRKNEIRASTAEPGTAQDDHTAPPQLRRCTCPTLFLAQPLNEGVCLCVCEWPDPSRRRDCLSLARGREHFSLRDRVCIDRGDCNAPSCEHGPYDTTSGKCPQRRYRRLRYYHHRRLPDNTSD